MLSQLGTTANAKSLFGILSLSLAALVLSVNTAAAPLSKLELGAALFFDTDLSHHRTQSCASCHDPAHAFIDARDNSVDGAASVGADGQSIGDRNTPSIAYASLTPTFGRDPDAQFYGGLFVDGRAADLVTQALEPLLNPLEMALPNKEAILHRIQEKPEYIAALRANYGDSTTLDAELAVAAVASSIADFERSAAFVRFDSKYDRHLRGEYTLSALEELGRSLFFSPLTNCASCHLLHANSLSAREPFTNYRYHNIGVPINKTLRRKAGIGKTFRDEGLLNNPSISDPNLSGKFKVPSLRNVAVTAPYMHNGVFRQLKTAILFYNQYIVESANSRTNPESGIDWGAAEIPRTIDRELLRLGQPIDDGRANALIAFLRTLTDARYEHLLP